jgi:phospholipid/cholesterol/gamma-HCH transport system substrate-binding protein
MAVGVLVALVFAGLAVFTIAISGKNLFDKNVSAIEVVMPDAMGLRANDPVIARGTTVGSVKDVRYKQDGVHVQAQLEAPVEFHEGYSITVVATSILGGRQLVLKEGDPAAPVVSDTTALVGQKPSDLMEDAAAAIARVRDFLETDALDNFRDFSESIKIVGARLENGEGTLGKLLSTDDSAYQDLRETLANLKTISSRLESGEGTLGKLLSSDDSLYRNLDGAITDVREVIDDVREANTLSTATSIILGGF